MKKIVIATIHEWNIVLAKDFQKKYKGTVVITEPSKLTYKTLKLIDPDYIFFPHWSWKIPRNIYENFECIIFHMTDLPYGRGGSPLQNLIERGHEKTKISALRVVEQVDAGPIYFKTPLSLRGTAQEIYARASVIIFKKMIPLFIGKSFLPKPQEGEIVLFKRRTPDESELSEITNLTDLFNQIRMLDAPGYPRSFIKVGKILVRFSKAKLLKNKIVAEANLEVLS